MPTKQIALFESPQTKLEIKKHSSIVQMWNITTLQERKTMNALLWIAKDMLKRSPEERMFSCDIGLLKRLAWIRDNDNSELKEALRTLEGLKIEYNILGKDRRNERGIFRFLSEVKIVEEWVGKQTTISFEFPTTVLETVKNPQIFVKLDLLIIRGLESKHSVALYELLKDYINLWRLRCELGDFKRLMGIGEGQYTNFTMLRKRVLDCAVQEINEKTDIVASYELLKTGRLATGIAFKMQPKEQFAPWGNLRTAITEKLTRLGIGPSKIEELLKKHDEQYLLANIAIVEEQLKKKNIQNVPAYLISALKADYRPTETERSKQQQETTQQQQAEQAAKEQEGLQMQQAKDQFERERKAAIENALKDITESEQQALLTGFVMDNDGNVFFQKRYVQGGLNNPFVQGKRQNFIAQKLLPERLHSLEQFVAFRHHIEVEKGADV